MANQVNRIKTLVGIEFTQNSLNIASIVRNGREPEVKLNLTVPCAYDLYADQAEKIGQELKQQLQQHKIHAAHGIVVLPNQSILKHRFELPDLQQDDLENFINLQIERLFPYQLEDLSVSKMIYTVGSEQQVLLSAVPMKLIERIQKICAHAGIHLLSVTTGNPESSDGNSSTLLYLRFDQQNIDFYALYQSDIIAFRTFNFQFNPEHDDQLSLSNFIRELKISISELPNHYLAGQDTIYLEGFHVLSPDEKAILTHKLDLMEFSPRFVESTQDHDIRTNSPLVGAALRYCQGKRKTFNFLPPKVHPFHHLLSKISSKRNVYILTSTAAVCMFMVITLVMQTMKLNQMNNRWLAIESKVEELELLQNNIKEFRPWFDSSHPNLRRLLVMSQLFPEEGSVWVKNIKIEDLNQISCTGFARNNQNLLAVLDQINQAEQIAELQVQQVQGENPIQFAVKMNWIEG